MEEPALPTIGPAGTGAVTVGGGAPGSCRWNYKTGTGDSGLTLSTALVLQVGGAPFRISPIRRRHEEGLFTHGRSSLMGSTSMAPRDGA
jgi:hypothetical protein